MKWIYGFVLMPSVARADVISPYEEACNGTSIGIAIGLGAAIAIGWIWRARRKRRSVRESSE